jgi:hypothetical protein
MWEEEDVWILGGGPSVPEQFGIPSKIVQTVMNRTSPPSVYSSYMKGIHNKHVIGVNMAFTIGDWMDIVFFGDNGFFLRYQEQLANYPGLRVTCTGQTSVNVPWMKVLEKDTEHVRGISRIPGKISWNKNSGAAAINLAAHTGAKRIILLGFDMNLNENKNQHWHDIYQRGKIEEEKDRRRTAATFERHLKGFAQIAFDARVLGIEILNASPTSEIKEFRKTTVKELL